MKYIQKNAVPLLIVSFFLLLTFGSCKKVKVPRDGGTISFSTDTLTFDTVFTSIGSFTNSFKIYNNQNQPIVLSEIKLAGGQASPFRMNVDGLPGKEFHDIEIAANDSIYVFVAVTIDPTTGNLPFLVEEKVQVTLNEKQFQLPLEAYGQDAHYIVDSVLTTANWVNDKPYVIIHSALVDSAQTLTIQKGCRIYMHQDSKLYVAGTLLVYGTKKDSVIFQGDRLDRSYFGYKDFPGEWGGLVFTKGSVWNNLNYCVIKNAGNATGFGYPSAIHVSNVDVIDTHPMLELTNCSIYNSAGYGVIAFASQLRFGNTLIHSCNQQCLALVEGGSHEFNYCTFANYGALGVNHAQEPTLAAINFRETAPSTYSGTDLSAAFHNCLIYGSLDDEVAFNKLDNWGCSILLNHCLIRRSTALPSYVQNNNTLINQDPQFRSSGKFDFHVESSSPAKNAGVFHPYYLRDLDDKVRSTSTPTIGCYEAD